MKFILHLLTLIFVCAFYFTHKIVAQDIEFSQFYSSKNYLNPAFTALSHDQSFTSTYRNQWPGIKNAYDSYFVSFDRRLKGKQAAFGLYYLGDIAGEGALQKQSIAFQFAKHIRFSRNIYGSFGLKGSYNSTSIKWDRLVWGDMLDARNGIVYSTSQQQGASNSQYFDTGAGFLMYSDKLQGGFAIEHINRPQEGLLSIYETSIIPIRYKLHLGGNIAIQTVPNAPIITLSPQIIYTQQGKTNQTIVGSYLSYNQFSIGLWHRINDSFIILLGAIKDNFKFGYSYDIGSNKLMSHSGGAHEISISYSMNFTKGKKQRKYKVISCPVF